MGHLHQRILNAIKDDCYVVSDHADTQVRERGIMLWQVIDDTPNARLLTERPETAPNPTIELEIILSDGTRAKAVWGLIETSDHAKLVTVHFFNR
jgi:hypothetical protein